MKKILVRQTIALYVGGDMGSAPFTEKSSACISTWAPVKMGYDIGRERRQGALSSSWRAVKKRGMYVMVWFTARAYQCVRGKQQ